MIDAPTEGRLRRTGRVEERHSDGGCTCDGSRIRDDRRHRAVLRDRRVQQVRHRTRTRAQPHLHPRWRPPRGRPRASREQRAPQPTSIGRRRHARPAVCRNIRSMSALSSAGCSCGAGIEGSAATALVGLVSLVGLAPGLVGADVLNLVMTLGSGSSADNGDRALIIPHLRPIHAIALIARPRRRAERADERGRRAER